MTRLYRKPGAFFAWCFGRLGVSPNIVTLISSVCATIGAAIITLPMAAGIPSFQIALAAFSLQVLGYALDCSDGQLARAMKLSSKYGQWLDHVADAWKIILIHCCFGWAGIRIAETDASVDAHWPFAAMVINLTGSLLYFFGWNLKVLLSRSNLIGSQMSSARSRLMKLPLQFTEFGVFIFIFLALPLGIPFIWIYLLYGLFSLVVCFMYLAATAVAMSRAALPDAHDR